MKASSVLCLGLVLFPAAAVADILPPPGVRERAFAEQISHAGHPCPTVSAFSEMTDEAARKLAQQGLVAYTVACTNGKKYLVANPPRQRGYVAKPPKPATPIVQALH
jgi:hypothetical protein